MGCGCGTLDRCGRGGNSNIINSAIHMTWEELTRLRKIWLGEKLHDFGWPEHGIAVEGDFAGIQSYVLKPVPGAKGAAKRLRGRSVQVSAITALIAERVRRSLPHGKVFYSAGGRFLLWGLPFDGWEKTVVDFQTELDRWMGKQFRGEVAFHLAAAEFLDGRIPRSQLGTQMSKRRARPLEGLLLDGNGWLEGNFERSPGQEAFQCPGCLTTADLKIMQEDEDDVAICPECSRDKSLGAKLAQARREVSVIEDASGDIPFIEGNYTIGDGGTLLEVIHRMPREAGEAMSLEQIAEKARGRKWLAYLRLDADSIGSAFRRLENDPSRVKALSELLQGFFYGRVQELLDKEQRYAWIYPVYGGGDDLFVIGPWNLVIDFAAELEKEFHRMTAGALSFSAGIALSKARQHVLSKADEAEKALERAKAQPSKRSIHMLGETFSWQAVPRLLQTAEKVVAWYERGLIASQFLQRLITLHREWLQAAEDGEAAAPSNPLGRARGERYRALLHYEAERNLTRADQEPVREWIEKLKARDNIGSGSPWAECGFVARYAILSVGAGE